MPYPIIPIARAEALIPAGLYCYTVVDTPETNGTDRMRIKCCPFWEHRADQPEQENGYCRYLKQGDWEAKHWSLLWDQVKECGIKMDGEFTAQGWQDANGEDESDAG